MKRLASILLVLCLLCPVSAWAAEDYTVAEKLGKQLWAGSGFSGTLTVEMQSETGVSTQKPIVLDADYIYVRETAESTAEHRLDLSLMDGESAVSAACAQLKDGAVSFQADFISPDWYLFAPSEESSAAQAMLSAAWDSLLTPTGAPGLAQTALAVLTASSGNDALDKAIEPYTTRIDVWMEGYRGDTVLSKLPDGESAMQVDYTVPAAAIKAQMKQLVLDLLADGELLMLLYETYGEDAARLYFNPVLQNWYFGVIEALPLEGDLTLSRTVSLRGDVLETHLVLPMADAQTGAASLSYDRTRGDGDLPDHHALCFETAQRTVRLLYQTYSSMTGVNVVQGTLDTGDAAVAFTLKQQETLTRDDESRDVYGWDLDITLQPAAENPGKADFAETQIVLQSRFMSRELKSAPTECDITLNISDEASAVKAHFNGTSRKKWEPDELPPGRTDISTLTNEDILAILPGAAVRFTALMEGYVVRPEQPATVSE